MGCPDAQMVVSEFSGTKEMGVLRLRSRNVRRMLWRVDHEQMRLDLKREREMQHQVIRDKYNFDFEQGRPLSGGRYKWEPVNPEQTEREEMERGSNVDGGVVNEPRDQPGGSRLVDNQAVEPRKRKKKPREEKLKKKRKSSESEE